MLVVRECFIPGVRKWLPIKPTRARSRLHPAGGGPSLRSGFRQEAHASLRFKFWSAATKKNDLLPGQAEGRVTSMDTTKQQA
jgi:hypothetical protein